MARTFGSYSPPVPMGVTWEESVLLVDEDGNPIDLTGYSVYAQFRTTVAGRAAGIATTAPVAELTSAGFYASPPAWPVVEGFSIPTPTHGTVNIKVEVEPLWVFNPTNDKKRKLLWAIVLLNKDTGYAIPVLDGKPMFKAATSFQPVPP